MAWRWARSSVRRKCSCRLSSCAVWLVRRNRQLGLDPAPCAADQGAAQQIGYPKVDGGDAETASTLRLECSWREMGWSGDDRTWDARCLRLAADVQVYLDREAIHFEVGRSNRQACDPGRTGDALGSFGGAVFGLPGRRRDRTGSQFYDRSGFWPTMSGSRLIALPGRRGQQQAVVGEAIDEQLDWLLEASTRRGRTTAPGAQYLSVGRPKGYRGGCCRPTDCSGQGGGFDRRIR